MWEWLPHPRILLSTSFQGFAVAPDAGSIPAAATMTEEARQRRRTLDHERYMRNREERKMHQRIYYRENREMYLQYRKMRVINEKRKSHAVLHEKEKGQAPAAV